MQTIYQMDDATVEVFTTREEWLAARRSYGIGSSDVPAIVGVSRFQSALSLYHEKLGVTKPSAAYEEMARWGHILEEPISQRYAEETKRAVYDPNAGGHFKIMRSRARPHMIASVDRLIVGVQEGGKPLPGVGHGVLEIKNAHLMMKDQWLGEHNNEPPVEYQIQLQHQLAVSGATWGSIAALIGGSMFVWADVPRDQALIDKLIQLEDEFMARLEARDPPKADGSESSTDVLKRIYPKDTGATVVLPIEAVEYHFELEGAKEAEKAAKANIDKYSNLLKQLIGDATCGVMADGNAYTYKLQSRAEFVSPYCEFRVLRPKKGGSKK